MPTDTEPKDVSYIIDVLEHHCRQALADKKIETYEDRDALEKCPAFNTQNLIAPMAFARVQRLSKDGQSPPPLFFGISPSSLDKRGPSLSFFPPTPSRYLGPVILDFLYAHALDCCILNNPPHLLSENALDVDLYLCLQEIGNQTSHILTYAFSFKGSKPKIIQSIQEAFYQKARQDEKLPNQVKRPEKKWSGEEIDQANEKEQKSREPIKKLIQTLYTAIDIKRIDSINAPHPQGLEDHIKKNFLCTIAFNCSTAHPLQQDTYSCADCVAMNMILLATDGLKKDSYNVNTLRKKHILMLEGQKKEEQKKIANPITSPASKTQKVTEPIVPRPAYIPAITAPATHPKTQPASSDFSFPYLTIRSLLIFIICIVINYFLEPMAIAPIGGFFGMLGIALAGQLLLECIIWSIQTESLRMSGPEKRTSADSLSNLNLAQHDMARARTTTENNSTQKNSCYNERRSG